MHHGKGFTPPPPHPCCNKMARDEIKMTAFENRLTTRRGGMSFVLTPRIQGYMRTEHRVTTTSVVEWYHCFVYDIH